MHQICVPLNLGSRLMWTKDKLCDEPNKWFSCESFATNTIGMDSNNTRFFKIIGGPEHLFRKCVLNFLYSVCILLELTSKYWNILVKSQRMGSQLWSGQRASKILVQRRLCWERNLKFGPKSAPEVTYKFKIHFRSRSPPDQTLGQILNYAPGRGVFAPICVEIFC